MSSTWWRRVWYLLNRPRFERDLTREMREHREMMADPGAFGDQHRLLERSRDAWGWNWLDDVMQDLSVGVRTLLRSPSFTVTATLILTFGIGLNVTLYHMAQVALLRPPAITSPDTLARFHRTSDHWSSTSVPYPVAQFVKEHSTVLSAVLVEAGSTVAWGADAIEQVEASFVSANWFEELGYGAAMGRVFSDQIDTRADAAPAAVLGYRFWSTRLGRDPGVVGTTVQIDRRPVTVVGVAPPELPGLDFDVVDVFLPILQREYFYPESDFLRAWNTDTVGMYGRLRAGVSPAAARDALRATMQGVAAHRPHITAAEWLEPLMGSQNFMRARERVEILTVLLMLASLTSLVLLVAAANLGNLVLSRATGRVRELGVRMALGARRTRIIRQLVVEAMPLAALGALGSLLFASLASSIIAAVTKMPPYLDFSVEWRTVIISGGFASLALVVIGLLPAWKMAQHDLTNAIKDGGQHVSRLLDRAFVRRAMVAAQVAGSCLLLVVAGMMIRGVQRVMTTSLGFDYQRAAVLSMPLGRYGISGDAARSYWYSVKERVLANPETESAAIVTAPPLGGRVFETAYNDAPRVKVLSQAVDPEYFAVMRIPIRSGRIFGPGESGALVVSRQLAIEMYGTENVLGEPFPKSAGGGRSTASDVAVLIEPEGTIVGVAADAHTIKVNATNVVELYVPLKPTDFSLVYLVARAKADPAGLLPVLREAAGLDTRVIPAARLMRDDFDRRMRGPWLAGAIAAGIGMLTLALACLGIFGVVSYGVTLRTKEIGIRIALGAKRPALLRAVVRQVLTPVGLGLMVGLMAAVPIGRALGGEPFYLQNVDAVAFAAALAVFVTAGALAALWPALRVLKADPVRSLRHE